MFEDLPLEYIDENEEMEIFEMTVPLKIHNKENRNYETYKNDTEKRQTKRIIIDSLDVEDFSFPLVQEADAHSKWKKALEFIRNAHKICFYTIMFVGGLIFLIAVPIAMIIFGSIYLYQCPAEKNIPIFLIVGGVFVNIKTVLSVFFRVKKNENKEWKITLIPTIIFQFFTFAWFITGCVWIYGIYPPNYEDLKNPRYCNRTLYLFSFWTITSLFTLLLFYICCICFFKFSLKGD